MSINVNANKKLGPIKPVNGICNGPVSFGGLMDISELYKQAAFPYCRLHDTNYPNAGEVDVHTIFRNFDADADDPVNYTFAATDVYLAEVEATGAKIIFRLGTSIEHKKKKFFIHPPADNEKWAKICLNIARHYNEGWADGFYKNIMYWEVWNEPDLLHPNRHDDAMWSGTPRQYYELYGAVARLFKNEMPNVKIGGYGACNLNGEGRKHYFLDFLQYVKDNELPLDFLSWHIYMNSLAQLRTAAVYAREQLDAYGFTHTEIILDEWNYLTNRPIWDTIFSEGGAVARREVFLESAGVIGMAFTAAALIEMVSLPVDIATFYDGQPTNLFCTIFDRFGLPTKQFYAFDVFNQVTHGAEQICAQSEYTGIYVLAVASENQTRVMLVNSEGRTAVYPLTFEGLDTDARYNYQVFMVDETRNLEKTAEGNDVIYSELPLEIYLHVSTVGMIIITKISGS